MSAPTNSAGGYQERAKSGGLSCTQLDNSNTRVVDLPSSTSPSKNSIPQTSINPRPNPWAKMFSASVSHHPRQHFQTVTRQDWTSWHEVRVKLEAIPLETTTLEIFQSMQAYGRINSITIPAISKRDSAGHAYINFSPVPTNAFWATGTIPLTVRGRPCRVRIALRNPRPPQMISSPVRSNVTYPEESFLRLARLDFGVLSQERTMDIMKTIQHPVYYPILTINLKHKKLEMQFTCPIEDPRREDPKIHYDPEPVGTREKAVYPPEFKAEIKFLHLQKAIYVDIDKEYWCLVVSQKHPPRFWKRRRNMAKSHHPQNTKWGDLDTWVRTTTISYADWAKKYPVTMQEPFQFIDIGKWTTYRLLCRKSDTSNWQNIKTALNDFNIQVISTDVATFTWRQGFRSAFRDTLDDPVVINTNDHLALLYHVDTIPLSYEVRYQLESAISQGVMTEQSITSEFLLRLSEMDTGMNEESRKTKRLNRAKNVLEYVTEANKPIYNPMTVLKDKFALTHHITTVLPEYCTWVRKLIVTPSKVYLSSPTPETTNRVLRNYAKESDRFIRVQFTDERTEGRIHAYPDSDVSDALLSRVYRCLRHGIRIGDRHFHFLAFGNSQFREHGAYFFCPTATISCDDIRDWMGDFRHIDVVAKYASRLGQCFSTTRHPRGLGLGLSVREIPDIKINGWCFSDGVGIISSWLASEVAKKLNMYQNGKIPSAFQFRHGGSKGILVNWPQAKFNELCLRPSQQKFNARARNLEIIRPSRFSVATLNRQTISILSCLGVSDDAFISLTENQLSEYSAAMSDGDVALRLLGRFIDENGMTTTIAQMIKDGFMESQEPFTKALLQLWRAWSMKLLREKARIVVENGAFVFGCIDETRTLRGQQNVTEANLTKDRSKLPQVFLQVPRADQPDSFQVINGLCVVGRNPSLHPGDLRVVEAVDSDVPELKALRNVLVFPADGDRDIPSMCSGGDLDGDDYFIFWDPKLLPEEWNYPPMTHDAIPPPKTDKNVTIGDITRFFVEYLKNDSLSTIALAHVAWSDRLPDGPKSPECIELAQLHSNAVDYVKTGQPAQIPKILRPRFWPHFMERDPKKSYRSRNVVGKLYDLVAKVDFTPDFEGPFDHRILRRYNLSDDLLRLARGVKTQYDIAMRRIMNQREIATEFEVWSTFVMSRPRIGTNYKIQEDMGLVMAELRDSFVQACIEQAGAENSKTNERDRSKLYPFIAAMYRVTWEEVQISIQEWHETRMIAGQLVPKRRKDQVPFISFPWLFESDLGRIAVSATTDSMELDAAPSVPPVVQATTVTEAVNSVAASLVDGRLFHRGDEIFMTMLDVGEDADYSQSKSGGVMTSHTESAAEVTEKIGCTNQLIAVQPTVRSAFHTSGSNKTSEPTQEESVADEDELEEVTVEIEEEAGDAQITSGLRSLHLLTMALDNE